MGLLSRLLGKAGEELVKNVVDKAVSEAGRAVNTAVNGQGSAAPAPQAARESWDAVPEGPSGFSWGPTMPAEENQFNSGLGYAAYFEGIFRAEFADYTLLREERTGGKSTVFTFVRDGRKALVVELLSQSSDAQKLRRDCAVDCIPYLRYYYDHEGWWNTRAYVVSRTRAALGA